MGRPQALSLERLACLVLAAAAAWTRGADPLDDQHLFRAAVALAIAAVVLLKAERKTARPWLSLGPAWLLFFVPVLGPSAALAWIAYRLLPRWPILMLAVLTLPLDPWFAEPLAWPLRRVTALVGGALSGVVPYDPTGTWLPVTWGPDAAKYGGIEPFRINDKCAGLAQVESMLALIGAMLLLAVARFRQGPALALVLAAPLFAVLVNGLRVAMSMWAGRLVGRGPWEGWIHDLPAFVCFAILIYALLQLVRRIELADPEEQAE